MLKARQVEIKEQIEHATPSKKVELEKEFELLQDARSKTEIIMGLAKDTKGGVTPGLWETTSSRQLSNLLVLKRRNL